VRVASAAFRCCTESCPNGVNHSWFVLHWVMFADGQQQGDWFDIYAAGDVMAVELQHTLHKHHQTTCKPAFRIDLSHAHPNQAFTSKLLQAAARSHRLLPHAGRRSTGIPHKSLTQTVLESRIILSSSGLCGPGCRRCGGRSAGGGGAWGRGGRGRRMMPCACWRK